MEMFKKNSVITIIISLIILNTSIISAKAVNINQYYEIDFRYTNIINGKNYTEEAVLLRDKGWLAENNIHKEGDTLILNIPEFGVINAKATAKEVKSTTLNPIKAYTNNQSMVTGTFKHYSTDVREYTLKDTKTGNIQTIQATPNHAFYVQNRTIFNKALNEQSHFIEIQDITLNDKLINEAGNVVQLVCDNKACGKQLVTNNKPLPVYNLEIFNQHQYMVVSDKLVNNKKFNISLSNAVLVHNVCDINLGGYRLNLSELKEPIFKPKFNGVEESEEFYKFGIRTLLSDSELETIKEWGQFPIDSISENIDPNIKKNIILSKNLSLNIYNNHNIQPDKSIYSVVYRKNELIGLSKFILEDDMFGPGPNISETVSSPNNLLNENNRYTGFGARLKYVGLEYIKNNTDINDIYSNAITLSSAKINMNLNFKFIEPNWFSRLFF
ncbi:hypothetical protein ACFX5K_01745 [Rickettsiales bacterium LUAb2]